MDKLSDLSKKYSIDNNDLALERAEMKVNTLNELENIRQAIENIINIKFIPSNRLDDFKRYCYYFTKWVEENN